MKTRHGIVPGYNAQSMVSATEVDDDASGMLITAVDVVDEPDRLRPVYPDVGAGRGDDGRQSVHDLG